MIRMNWESDFRELDTVERSHPGTLGQTFADDQLDVIAGKRDQLSGRIQEAYGLTKEETERQLRNWERNLTVDYEETDLVLDDDDTSSTQDNGRG